MVHASEQEAKQHWQEACIHQKIAPGKTQMKHTRGGIRESWHRRNRNTVWAHKNRIRKVKDHLVLHLARDMNGNKQERLTQQQKDGMGPLLNEKDHGKAGEPTAFFILAFSSKISLQQYPRPLRSELANMTGKPTFKQILKGCSNRGWLLRTGRQQRLFLPSRRARRIWVTTYQSPSSWSLGKW